MSNNRNVGVDILKAICAFLVVSIHKGIMFDGGSLRAISRIAVPIFLMITGYYYQDIKNKNREFSQIKKIFKYYLIACFVYLVHTIITNILKDISIQESFFILFDYKYLLTFIFFNFHPYAGVAWYLGSLLYVLIIAKYVTTTKLCNLKIILLLFILGVALGKYSVLIFNCDFDIFVSRNFIFCGLSFFLLGNYIRNVYKKIKELDNKKLLILIVVFSFTTVLEHFFLKDKSFEGQGDLYFSTIFLAAFVFILFINKYNNKNLNPIEKILSHIGNEYSLYIYIIHPIIKTYMDLFNEHIYKMFLYKYFGPFVIYALSILLIFIFKTIKKPLSSRLS